MHVHVSWGGVDLHAPLKEVRLTCTAAAIMATVAAAALLPSLCRSTPQLSEDQIRVTLLCATGFERAYVMIFPLYESPRAAGGWVTCSRTVTFIVPPRQADQYLVRPRPPDGPWTIIPGEMTVQPGGDVIFTAVPSWLLLR